MGNPIFYRTAKELAEQTGQTVVLVAVSGDGVPSAYAGHSPDSSEIDADELATAVFAEVCHQHQLGVGRGPSNSPKP